MSQLKVSEGILYECPYCIATKCNLKDGCLRCGTFSKYFEGKTTTRVEDSLT